MTISDAIALSILMGGMYISTVLATIGILMILIAWKLRK